MKIAEIEKKYVDDLTLLDDAASQMEYLIMLGMERPEISAVREAVWRIGGCKTAIWMKAWKEPEGIRILSDSDSILVKGLLVILEEMYAGKAADEIQAYPPRFLDWISDDVIYPEIKNNGIAKWYQRLATLIQ